MPQLLSYCPFSFCLFQGPPGRLPLARNLRLFLRRGLRVQKSAVVIDHPVIPQNPFIISHILHRLNLLTHLLVPVFNIRVQIGGGKILKPGAHHCLGRIARPGGQHIL